MTSIIVRVVAGIALLALGLTLQSREHGTLAWLIYSAGVVLMCTVLLPLLRRYGADPYGDRP